MPSRTLRQEWARKEAAKAVAKAEAVVGLDPEVSEQVEELFVEDVVEQDDDEAEV